MKVDVLVNANKHSCDFAIKKDKNIKLLVKNIDDDGSGILHILKNRLGFKTIKKVEKATMWSLTIDGDESEQKRTADKAAKELLVNGHYQQYSII